MVFRFRIDGPEDQRIVEPNAFCLVKDGAIEPDGFAVFRLPTHGFPD
jgi:hypothetical protein